MKFPAKILLLLGYSLFSIIVIFSSWLPGLFLMSFLSFIFVWEYEKKKKRNPVFSFVNIFIAGNIMTIGAGVCLRVFEFPDYGFTVTTGLEILVPLLCVGIIFTIIGMIAGDIVFRPFHNESADINKTENYEKLLKNMFILSFVLLLIFDVLILFVTVPIRDYSNDQSFGGYVIQALNIFQYLPFVLLGLIFGLKDKVSKFWLVIAVIFIVWRVFLLALEGGRSPIVISILLVIICREIFKVNYKRLFISCLCFILFAIPMFVILANYREKVENLKEGDEQLLYEKMNSFAMEEESETNAALILSRIYERRSGQVVDIVNSTRNFAGFKNMDSLFYMYIPNKLLKNPVDKLVNNNILIEMGLETYEGSEYSTSPIILLADSFRRWGIIGVIFVFFFCGFILISLQNFIKANWKNILFVIIYPVFMVYALRLYVWSVPGLLYFIFYTLVKYCILIGIFVFCCKNIFEMRKVAFLHGKQQFLTDPAEVSGKHR